MSLSDKIIDLDYSPHYNMIHIDHVKEAVKELKDNIEHRKSYEINPEILDILEGIKGEIDEIFGSKLTEGEK